VQATAYNLPGTAIRKRIQILCAGLLLMFAVFAITPAHAAEEILHFDSAIAVQADSSLVVEETIRVRAEGRQIRRGIYRDIRRRVPLENGLWRYVGYDILEVLRDGNPEPYHTENKGDFLRIYAGDADVYIPDGEYTYTLRYRTTRQLRYFAEFDELYWNVTGNFWTFPIRKATARVTLPEGARVVQSAAFTGGYGAAGSDYEARAAGGGVMNFTTTRPLQSREGLTIAVAWPKGFVTEPGGFSTTFWKLWDNLGVVLLLAGTLGVTSYFFTTWWRIGRDPEKGLVIPLFAPPENLSAAATSYVYYQGFDRQGRGATKPFIAALLSLAAKGHMRIADEGDDMAVEATETAPTDLPSGEGAIYDGLLGGRDRLDFTKKNGVRIKNTQSKFSSAIKREYEGVFFRKNIGYFVIGSVLTVATCIAYLVLQQPSDKLAGMSVIAFFLTLAGTFVLFLGIRRLFGWIPGDPSKILGVLFTLVGIVLLLPLPLLPVAMDDLLTALIPAAVALMGFMLIAFLYLLSAPTKGGRKVMDQIEGFRLYLSVAEAERMNMTDAPEVTPQIFETFLPYAISLGVEKPWSEAFANHLAKSAVSSDEASHYHPTWYRGSDWSVNRLGSATSGLVSAMSSNMASAMPAPKSSSGSSGGGFSGGGGGGGGGGGW